MVRSLVARLAGSPDDVLANLQTAARMDLGDFFAFEVVPDGEHPEIQNDGMHPLNPVAEGVFHVPR